MLAVLPGFARPRTITFESVLEYGFLCLMLVRNDVHLIQEQPSPVFYTADDGAQRSHTFDFLVTLTSGERIAVAIKPSKRVKSLGFISELERIAAATTKQFASSVRLVTELHIDQAAAADAARTLAARRPSLLE